MIGPDDRNPIVESLDAFGQAHQVTCAGPAMTFMKPPEKDEDFDIRTPTVTDPKLGLISSQGLGNARRRINFSHRRRGSRAIPLDQALGVSERDDSTLMAPAASPSPAPARIPETKSVPAPAPQALDASGSYGRLVSNSPWTLNGGGSGGGVAVGFQLGVIVVKSFPASELDENSLQIFGTRVMLQSGMLQQGRCAAAGLLILMPCHNIYQLVTPSCEFICRSRNSGLVEAAMRAEMEDTTLPPGYCEPGSQVLSPELSAALAAAISSGIAEVSHVLLQNGFQAESTLGKEQVFGVGLEEKLFAKDENWGHLLTGALMLIAGLLLGLLWCCVCCCLGPLCCRCLGVLDPHQLDSDELHILVETEEHKQQLLHCLADSKHGPVAITTFECNEVVVPKFALLRSDEAMVTHALCMAGVQELVPSEHCWISMWRRGSRGRATNMSLDYTGVDVGREENQMGISGTQFDVARLWAKG
mmetsp:Transcript_86456/g.197230  ORF Transcript_86456/g.197230 Transcript_86456/m.197230 type:complete len:473 (-) Transcript_86456:225-1643(-)